MLLLNETTIIDSQLRFVEGLVGVEAHSVACSVLVSVLILLSAPVLPVPELSVAFVARGVCVGPLGDDQLGTVFKGAVGVSRSQVWSVMDLWALEAGSGGRREVVFWLVVGSIIHHGPGAVTTRGGVE